MESTIVDAISSVLGDEFKKEMVKRDNIIRTLKDQEDNLNKEIGFANSTLADLNEKVNNISVTLEESKVKQEEFLNNNQSKFDLSIKSTTESLDNRESDLNKKESDIYDKSKELDLNICEFNLRKEQFSRMKLALIEEFEELNSSVNSKTSEAIEEIKKL